MPLDSNSGTSIGFIRREERKDVAFILMGLRIGHRLKVVDEIRCELFVIGSELKCFQAKSALEFRLLSDNGFERQ